MKKIITILIILASVQVSWAAETVFALKMDSSLVTILLGILAFLIVAVVLVLNKALRILMKSMQREEMLRQGMSIDEINKSNVSTEKSLSKIFTNAVDLDKEDDILLDHDYDGIKELDNVLPPWWVWMFYMTIIFGVFYWGYYETTGYGQSIEQEYAESMEKAKLAKFAKLASGNILDENSAKLSTDADVLANANGLFQKNCIACHGNKGQGTPAAPNLTDAYWKNKEGDFKSIFEIIKYGVPQKGMASWEKIFSPKQIEGLASLVYNFYGTNPEGAKAPEGDKKERIVE